jgi:hypothetical protein
VRDLHDPVEKERAAAYEQSVGPLARQSCESGVDFGDGAGVENAELYCQYAGSPF